MGFEPVSGREKVAFPCKLLPFFTREFICAPPGSPPFLKGRVLFGTPVLLNCPAPDRRLGVLFGTPVLLNCPAPDRRLGVLFGAPVLLNCPAQDRRLGGGEF